MAVFRIVLLLLITAYTLPLHASDDLDTAGRAAAMDLLLERAVSRGLIVGGVVLVGNSDGIIYTSSLGKAGFSDTAPPVDERTLFDVASLTKVIATTPAIMKLLETREISLLDPISRWFPEFAGTEREEVTILNLLTHTSCLSDLPFYSLDPMTDAITAAGRQKCRTAPGSTFRYADINFILLAELVHRVSGTSLDRFCTEHVFGPLGMGDTSFLPASGHQGSIASTLGPAHEIRTGIVQDDNARILGGIAGHAGLFSTAADLARFAVMLLHKGIANGKTIIDQQVLTQTISPYFYSNGRVIRGLGWDISSPYSSPRGSSFSSASFGHTGYSGTSIWIDPENDLYVILLTVRRNYRDIRHISRLRSDISTIAASVFIPAHPASRNREEM